MFTLGTTTEAPAAGYSYCSGWTDGVRRHYNGMVNQHNVASSVVGNTRGNAHLLRMGSVAAPGTVLLAVDFDSWDATNVTVDWETPAAGTIIYWVAVSDVDAHVNINNMNLSSPYAITGVGALSKGLLSIHSNGGQSGTTLTGSSSSGIGLGLSDFVNNYGLGIYQANNQSSLTGELGQTDTYSLSKMNAGPGTFRDTHGVDTPVPDGFTITSVQDGNNDLGYVALNPAAVAVEQVDITTTPGNQVVALSGITPDIAIIVSVGRAYTPGDDYDVDVNYQFAIGISDGLSNKYVTVSGERLSDPTDVSGDLGSDAVLKLQSANGASPTDDCVLGGMTFAPNQITLSKPTPPGAEFSAFIFAMETTPSGDASAATSTITPADGDLTTDGVETELITVQLKTSGGADLTEGGDTVELATDVGVLSGVTDNLDGTYTATLTSTELGTATVTGTVNSSPIADDALVTCAADEIFMDSVLGSDANEGTTVGQPWQTRAAWDAAIASGDLREFGIIRFAAGSSYDFDDDGPEDKIWFEGAGLGYRYIGAPGAGRVRFNSVGGDFAMGFRGTCRMENAICSGLQNVGGSAVLFTDGSAPVHVTLVNVDIMDGKGHGLTQLLGSTNSADSTFQISFGRVANNVLTGINLTGCEESVLEFIEGDNNTLQAIRIQTTGPNVFVQDCHLHHNGSEGVGIDHEHTGGGDETVQRCHMHHNAQIQNDTSGTKTFSNGTRYLNNHIHDQLVGNGATPIQHAIQLETTANDCVCEGNVCYNNIGDGISFTGSGHRIEHNTCFGNRDAGIAPFLSSVSSITIRNNLLTGNETHSFRSFTSIGGLVLDFNLHWGEGQAADMMYNSVVYAGLAAFQAGTAFSDNGVEGDPLLNTNNFSIPLTSPAAGAGTNLSTVVNDYDGEPFSDPPSIGAVEATAGGGPHDVEQEGFRWRNDDGTEVTATWAEAQDVGHSGVESVLRLRGILSAADGDPAAIVPKLKARRDGGAWANVPVE